MFPFVFAIGIAIAYLFIPVYLTWWTVLFTLLLTVLFALTFSRKPFLSSASSLFPIPLVLSTAIMLTLIQKSLHDITVPSQPANYDVVVCDEPQKGGKTTNVNVIIINGIFSGKEARLSFADTACASLFIPGDGLTVKCQLQKPSHTGYSNFNYARHLDTRGIMLTAHVPQRQWYSKQSQLDSLSLLQKAIIGLKHLRHQLLLILHKQNLSPESLAIVAAMTLGDKTMLTKQQRDTYSATGASHALALSGLHLTAIYIILTMLFLRRTDRWYSKGIILGLIWVYVFIVGMPPSATRSATMLTIYSIIDISNRHQSPLHPLLLTAMLMMASNPAVLFDVAFQLSFLAVLSIIVASRICANRPLLHYLLFNLLVFLLTFPLVAYYFGRIPIYFLATNIIVTPTAAFIVYLSMTTLALSSVPLVGASLSAALDLLVSTLTASLAFISRLPFSTISTPDMPFALLLLFYGLSGIIVSYILSINFRKIC